MKLGVTSDLHGSLGKARKFASYFKKADVDAVILTGDIPGDKNQKGSLAKILKIFVKTNKRVFVMPGSHEQYVPYYAALKKFGNRITDCTKTAYVKLKGLKIVFIPGADSTAAGAGFRLLPNRRLLKRFRKRIKELKMHFWGKIIPLFVNDFAKFADKDTIIISHVPPKFRTKNAVDAAIFGTPKKPFMLVKKDKKLKLAAKMPIYIPDRVVFPIKEARYLIKKGYPVKIKNENVGNPWLKAIIRKKRIKFSICSHIHESGGKANDSKGRPVLQNKWSNELFYNCSGRAGIVEFLNGKARYNNVR
jgi:Icc-related predicted phosphoesterase